MLKTLFHIIRKLVFAESIFIEIFLPESTTVLTGILYRPLDKCDFVNCQERTFRDTYFFESQENCLLGDININLQPKIKRFSDTNPQILLIKRYLTSLGHI